MDAACSWPTCSGQCAGSLLQGWNLLLLLLLSVMPSFSRPHRFLLAAHRCAAAVLESGAFGAWAPPDYKALAAASPAEYAAMREATRAPGGGAGASPAVAALPPPPMAKQTQPTIKEEEEEEDGEEEGAGVKQEPGVKQEGPPATPAGVKPEAGGEDENAQRSAAVAAALASPPPTPAQIAVEKRVADWLEQVLMPAINRQVGVGAAERLVGWACWCGLGCPLQA